MQQLTKPKKVVIIGAGFRGITAAKIFQDAGIEFVILDKNSATGGVWRTFANQLSYVQIPESEYRFDMEYPNGLPSEFTPRDEILAHAERFVKTYGIGKNILFKTEVFSIEDISNGRYRVHYKQDDCNKALEVDGIYYAGGRLFERRTVCFPGEENFQGLVRYGISDDIVPSEYHGKKVVIIGCGAFAMENARTALTNGATHVTILAKKINVVLPRMVMFWVNSMRLAPIAPLLKMSWKMYDWAGTDFMKENLDGFCINQRTVPIISDFIFLGHKVGKVEFKKGSIDFIDRNSIVTNEGSRIEADIVLKCVGFEGQMSSFKKIYPQFEAVNWIWVNKKNNFALDQDPEFGMTTKKTKLMTSGSTLLLTKIAARIFAMSLIEPSKFEQVMSVLPESETAGYDIPYHMSALSKLIANKDIKKFLLRLSAKKSKSMIEKGGNGKYFEFCKREWKEHCDALGVDEMEYPFSYPWWMFLWENWQQLVNRLFLAVLPELNIVTDVQPQEVEWSFMSVEP
ncbi:MAG: FAD-dependent oxidoreductase [Rhizonema sp. PD38]|nr:FAD-dependent oxidoreductase [Rhizonema sp. PD38]